MSFINTLTQFAGGAASQALNGMNSVNKDNAANTDLTSEVGTILTSVYFVIGMVAVVMIILGGVNYSISQGDPSKTKKAKDTILYGIIGLIIVIMAFAITNFVIGAL